MPAERYFIPEPLQRFERKLLQGAEFHHLVHVMRTRVGEAVELVNGLGALAVASVEAISKDSATLMIREYTSQDPAEKTLILAQGIPKNNRLDFILEKGTELGVSEFWLFPSQHSVKKELFASQLARMHSLTVAAMKQCGRLFLPKITIKPPLELWQEWSGAAFFGDTEPEAEPLWKMCQQDLTSKGPFTLFIGPESGFSDQETAWLKSRGVIGVKLHDNILRTDTAAILAIGLIEHWRLLS